MPCNLWPIAAAVCGVDRSLAASGVNSGDLYLLRLLREMVQIWPAALVAVTVAPERGTLRAFISLAMIG